MGYAMVQYEKRLATVIENHADVVQLVQSLGFFPHQWEPLRTASRLATYPLKSP